MVWRFHEQMFYIFSDISHLRIYLVSLIVSLFGDYEFLFDSPVNGRIDNDASGHSSIYIPAAGS